MDWICVKDRLPIDESGNPTYHWVLVCDPSGERIFIARYIKPDKKYYPDGNWEFWGEDSQCPACPCFCDSYGAISRNEIAYWCDPWKSMPDKEKWTPLVKSN